jgi:hypothetical protein
MPQKKKSKPHSVIALPQVARAQSAPQEFFIDEHELGRRLGGVALSTLRRWRQDGSGPPFRRVKKFVRYSWPDVLAWMEEHSPKVTSTTQADEAKRASVSP